MSDSPYLLALETSTSRSSVALYQGEKLLMSLTYHLTQSHSRLLPAMVRQLLGLCEVKVAQLQGVGLGIGPGSYTGLRIGASFAKGLCLSHKIPLFGMDTLAILEAAATGYPNPGMRFALLDARHQRAYGRLVDAKGQVLLPTQVVRVDKESFLPWLQKGPLTLIGSGADAYAAALQEVPGLTLIEGLYPEAKAMGPLLYRLFLKKETIDLGSFSPEYYSEKWAT